jgi:hypothetical protein
MTRHQYAAVFLVMLGTAQMTGDLSGVVALRAIAAATGASPAPKVFAAVQGLETYSTRFFFETAGRRIELTPALYARMRGPYNRRNAFGAAVAYAPVLPAALRDPTLRYALCGDRSLLRELGIDVPRSNDPVALVLEPRAGSNLGDLQTRFPVSCADPSGGLVR